MVVSSVTAKKAASPIEHLLHLSFWVLLMMFAGVVPALESPIEEVMLPEGISSAQSIAVDQAGRVWFTEKLGKKLAVYVPATNEFTSYPLPASWGDVGFSNFTLSPAGDIWFTVRRWAENAQEPHMLGKFSPGDAFFTKYVLSIETTPEELLVTDDGVIWFVASNKNRLYRVNPADFSVKGYPVPTANGYPRSLAVDGRGQIWFVEANANKIGKFIPGEKLFHEYEIPTPFANPGDIAIDKHDKVWFVELNTNRIAAFYPDRVRFDEALIPTARSSPSAILADELGNIWFLEYRGNKLGVFNPETAVFHEYPIPTFNSLPGALAIDRKRSVLWFSEGNTEAKRLGSLSIDKALGKDKQRDIASEGDGAFSERLSGGEGQKESAAIWLFLFASIVVATMLFGWFRYSRGQQERMAK